MFVLASFHLDNVFSLLFSPFLPCTCIIMFFFLLPLLYLLPHYCSIFTNCVMTLLFYIYLIFIFLHNCFHFPVSFPERFYHISFTTTYLCLIFILSSLSTLTSASFKCFMSAFLAFYLTATIFSFILSCVFPIYLFFSSYSCLPLPTLLTYLFIFFSIACLFFFHILLIHFFFLLSLPSSISSPTLFHFFFLSCTPCPPVPSFPFVYHYPTSCWVPVSAFYVSESTFCRRNVRSPDVPLTWACPHL